MTPIDRSQILLVEFDPGGLVLDFVEVDQCLDFLDSLYHSFI